MLSAIKIFLLLCHPPPVEVPVLCILQGALNSLTKMFVLKMNAVTGMNLMDMLYYYRTHVLSALCTFPNSFRFLFAVVTTEGRFLPKPVFLAHIFWSDFLKFSMEICVICDRNKWRRDCFKLMITYSMAQSPWEISHRWAAQEILSILWNLKIYNSLPRDFPAGPYSEHMNSVHILLTYICEIYYSILLPFMTSSSKWSPPFRYLAKIFYTFLVCRVRNFWWRVKYSRASYYVDFSSCTHFMLGSNFSSMLCSKML